MKVKKYNKKSEDFDKSKIINSIKAASNETKDENIPEYMINRIADQIETDLINNDTKSVTAEYLAKIIEDRLMQTSYKEVARSYITYHYDRQKEHVYNSDLIKAFEKKLNGVNIENSNANCDERSFSGRMNEASRVLLKDNALNTMSKKFRDNHNNNEIYTHDLDSFSSGMHNCFDSKTEFITSEGIRSFQNFIDGEVITVLAGDGEWREATVHCYGHKPVQKVELEYFGSKKDTDIVNVLCTKDHRWYLKDGTVTTDLKVGDKLIQLPAMKNFDDIKINTKEDAELWCLGFILGDSCDHYNYTQVLLCNDKVKYAPIFKKAFYHEGANCTKDHILFFKNLPVSKQQFLTNKMWKILNGTQKRLLFDGYIHADGNINRNKICGCSTSDERIVEFVKDLSCLCGYHIRRITEITHDTNFKKDTHLTCIDFFTKQNHTGYWIVKSITPVTHNSSVWCVEEPVTKAFTLAGGILTGNCLSIPFDPMFKYGVHIKQTDIRSPKSISTAFQLLAVYIQIQSLQQFGGVSATHLDWTMVPYVRHSFFKHLRDGKRYLMDIDWVVPDNCEDLSIDDFKNDECYKYAIDMTIRETLQGAEGLIHNLNSLQSRSGQQLPFSSINYGTCTLTEGRLVINAILDATLGGTGPLHKTPIFPCGIFQLDKNINLYPNTPNYDLFQKALYCTSKRFYPNYCNCDWSTDIAGRKKDIEHKRSVLNKLSTIKMTKLANWVKENPIEAKHYKMIVKNDIVEIDENLVDPSEIMSTMGCRTYNSYNANFDFGYIVDNIVKHNKPPKDYFYSGNQKDGRGNIAPATIILPTLAMKAKGQIGKKNIDDFFNLLNTKIEECRDSLIERFTLIASQSPASATFMYQNRTMLGYIPKEGIISALKHGTLAIGQIGIAETLQILIGKDHTTPEGLELAKRIENLFNSKCAEYKNKTYTIRNFYNPEEIIAENIKLNVGVYYTPKLQWVA